MPEPARTLPFSVPPLPPLLLKLNSVASDVEALRSELSQVRQELTQLTDTVERVDRTVAAIATALGVAVEN